VVTRAERNRFIEACENVGRLKAGELGALNVALPAAKLKANKAKAIF